MWIYWLFPMNIWHKSSFFKSICLKRNGIMYNCLCYIFCFRFIIIYVISQHFQSFPLGICQDCYNVVMDTGIEWGFGREPTRLFCAIKAEQRFSMCVWFMVSPKWWFYHFKLWGSCLLRKPHLSVSCRVWQEDVLLFTMATSISF